MIAGANVAWYAARAGGLVAFVLLTLATLAGLLLAGRAQNMHWPRFAVEDVHRYLGLLAGTFIWLHVLVLLVDSYLPFSVAQLTVQEIERAVQDACRGRVHDPPLVMMRSGTVATETSRRITR